MLRFRRSTVASGAEPPKTTTEQDIVYTKAGSAELKLDLARPAEGDGPFPAVVVIHGGAWRQGNKADVRPILPQFAQRGYVAISPQYRFCPKDAFPAQVHDVKAAVRWLKVKRQEIQGRSRANRRDRLFGGGPPGLDAGPDGARPTAWKATSPPVLPTAGSRPSSITSVRPTWPPATFRRSASPGSKTSWVARRTKSRKPPAKASPLTFVSKDDAPVLTFQGTKDPLVPFNQAIKLAEAMSSAGVPGRVELMVGAQHGWGGAEMERTIGETFDFFDRYLKPQTAGAWP